MRRALLAVVGIVVVVLIAAQIALPGVAARRLRSDLERDGSDVSVSVKAVPAIKLLWHRADTVTVRVGHLRTGGSGSGSGQSPADLLASTKAAGTLDVHVDVLDAGKLRVRDADLQKRGDRLVARVRMTKAAIDAALPRRLHVSARQVAPDRIAVNGRTQVFGRPFAGGAVVVIDPRGRVVLRPAGGLLASVVSVPVFSDDRVAVDGLTTADAGDGFAATVRGHLR